MQCYLQAFLLFALVPLLPVLHVLGQIASTSLVQREDRRQSRGGIPDTSAHDAASGLRRGRGPAGLCDRGGFDRYQTLLVLLICTHVLTTINADNSTSLTALLNVLCDMCWSRRCLPADFSCQCYVNLILAWIISLTANKWLVF